MNEQNENGINSPTNYNVPEDKKKKKTFLWLAVSIGIVALLSAMAFVFSIGSNTIGGSTDKEVNDVPGILMFASPDENPDVGNLYYQCYGKQKILIASNVSNGGYELLPKTQLVVYRDKNGKLFCKYPDQESELISANWNHYTVSENEKMIFLYEGDDLSCYTVGVGKEKITSYSDFDEQSLNFDEDNIYFSKSKTYYKWNLENGLEKLFSCETNYGARVSGAAYCYLSKDSNNEGCKLYAKLKNEDYEERISTMPISNYVKADFAHDDYSVVYIRWENGDYEFGMSGELCLYTKGCDEIEIASDVTNFEISDDDKYLYYTDEHGFLYVVELPKITKNSYKNPKRIIRVFEKLEPIKLGECNGFISITGNSEIVVFTDDEETLYIASAKTGGKSEVSSDVSPLHVTVGKNMCAFVTNSGNLFINNNLNAIKNAEKNNILLVKNMESSLGFGYSDDYSATENAQYLFYMNETDNKLYIVSDNGKAKVFIENVAEFDYIKHNGTVLYEKQLTRADIEGYYTANNEETSLFYKFGTDGTVEICSLVNDSSEERNYPEHIVGYSWEIRVPINKTESRISYKKDVDSQHLEYLNFKVGSDEKKYLVFEDSTLELRSVDDEEFEQIKSLTSAVTEYLDEDVEVSSDDTLYSEPNYNSTSDLKFTHSGEKTVKGYFISEDKSTIWLKLRINVDYESSYVWFPVLVVDNENV